MSRNLYSRNKDLGAKTWALGRLMALFLILILYSIFSFYYISYYEGEIG